MIRDLVTVAWITGGLAALIAVPFLMPGRGHLARDPALVAVAELAEVAVGQRRTDIEARLHRIVVLPGGVEVYSHPTCAVLRIDLRFAGHPGRIADDGDLVTAVSDPYLATNPSPRRFSP